MVFIGVELKEKSKANNDFDLAQNPVPSEQIPSAQCFAAKVRRT